MGTKLTPYQSISHFARGLKIYDTKNIKSMVQLLEAMRAWNLHGSADKIEAWEDRIYDCFHAEDNAEPLGIMDWNEMEEAFGSLRVM